MGLITQRVFDYSAGLSAGGARARPRAPAGHRGGPQRADRGDHRRERGRDADGPLPRRRGDRDLSPHRGPGEGGRPGHFYPVVPVCAETRVGLDALLELLTSAFPSPLEHDLPAVTGVDGSPRAPLTCDPDGPLVAEVVKTTIDSYVGRVSLVRVFSGTLRPEATVHVSGHGMEERGHPDHDADERVAHLYSPLGGQLREVPYAVAGDICAITKSSTRRDRRHPLRKGQSAARWARGTCPSRCCRSPSWPRPAPTRTRWPRTSAGSSPATRPCGWSATRRPTSWCCGAWARRTPTWCWTGCAPAASSWTPSRSRVALRETFAGRVQGPRPARQAVRRARPVRRLRHRGRAAAARLRASSSSTRSSAARCRTTTSRRWRRACGPRWSAASSPGTRWSTCGSPSSTARPTASTPPTRRSRPPARWRSRTPPRRGRCSCSSRSTR